LIEVFVKGERQLFAYDIKPAIEKYAKEFAKRIIDEKLLGIAPEKPGSAQEEDKAETYYEKVDINSIKHKDVREIGAKWLCKQAMEQLGLRNCLVNNYRFTGPEADLAMIHISSRAVIPASEHKTAQWIMKNSEIAGLYGYPLKKINCFKLYNFRTPDLASN
jgi:hypothetical protein